VAQEDSFNAGRSVRQILDDVPLTEDLTEAERSARTNAVLSRAGFTDTGISADTLSGGWRKRLAIARAVEDLVLIWTASQAEEWVNRIYSLPL